MAELAPADKADIAHAIGQAMLREDDITATLLAAKPGVDPKQLFCQNWDTVKVVLGFIGQQVGGPAAVVIKIIVAAGDALKGKIC